jgi:hypothetical protein
MAVTPAAADDAVTLTGILGSAGERLLIRSTPRRVSRVIARAVGSELAVSDDDHTIAIEIEGGGGPFALDRFEAVSRGVWRRGSEVVWTNVATSGFDLLVALDGERPRFTFRRRPTMAVRAADLLAARARQLTLLTLLAYPAMWWAARNGRAPLHVSAFEASGRTLLIAGATGVGKSTVLQQEMEAGARPISDNLCVTDGTDVWPVAEPMRVEGGGGDRAPHGRAQRSIRARPGRVNPDVVVVLRRGPTGVKRLDPASAARAIASGTYMAGELRRFWSFAALLAAATGVGPAHPVVTASSEALAKEIPCFEVARRSPADPPVSTLLAEAGVEAKEGVA